MGFVALDDEPQTTTGAPKGFVPVEDEPSSTGSFVPVEESAQEQLPAPEGPFASAFRSFASGILPAAGTAVGATGAGLLATPESVGIATIPAAIAGGAAGGFAGKKLQNAIMGDQWAKENERQLEANRKAHNIASGAGEIIPTMVSMAGGGGAVAKLAGIGERAIANAGVAAGTKEAEAVAAKAIEDATSGMGVKAVALRSAESALGGARLGASQTAQQDNPSIGDFADNIAKSSIQFGPLGILPHADSLAKALGYSIPQAGLTALSGAAYDSVVHPDKPMDYKEIQDKGLADIIPFALFNAVSHGVGMVQRSKESNLSNKTADTLDRLSGGTSPTAEVLRQTDAVASQAPTPDLEPPNEEASQNLPTGAPSEPEITEGGEASNVAEGISSEQPSSQQGDGDVREPQLAPDIEGTDVSGETDLTPAIKSSDTVIPAEEGEDHDAIAARTGQEGERGFLTGDGRFLSREEAAQESGIPTNVEEGKLHTSDVERAKSEASIPFMVTKDMEQQLADLGYTKAQRNAMTPQEASDILQGRSTEAKSEAPEAKSAPETPPESQTPPESPENAQKEAFPSPMASKNADVEQAARAAGLPEVLKGESVDFKREFVKAKEVMDANGLAGERLVDKLNDENKTPNYKEQVLLTHEFIRIINGLKASDAILDNPDSTPEEVASARIANDHWQERYDKTQHINRRAGTESSLALLARKMGIRDDFSYEGVLKRMMRAAGDPKDPEKARAVRKQAKQYSNELQREQKVVDEELAKKKAQDSSRTNEVVDELKKEVKAGKKIDKSDLLNRLKEFKSGRSKEKLLFSRPNEAELSRNPIGEEGLPEVSEAHQNAAVEKLKQTEIGRKVLRDAIIVKDWQSAISHSAFSDANRGEGFDADTINTIKKAEGFFDPVTGKSVVIRDNVRTRDGETPELAVRRVLLHERVGHEGADALRALDPKFDAAYRKIVSQIPAEELSKLKETYKDAEPDTLIKEWIADQFGKLDPDSIPDPRTPFGKFWQAVRDFLARYFGDDDRSANRIKLDQRVRDLMGQVVRSHEALESRRGFGDVMASKPEEPESSPKDVSQVPHSLLADIARFHIGEGVEDVHDLTTKMKSTLEEAGITSDENGIHRALSKYGKVIKPTEDEIEKELSDNRTQMRLLSQLKDAQEGTVPAKTGFQRGKLSPEARALDKQVRDEMRSKDLHRKSEDDRRASSLDAKKSRLENEIQDVEKQVKDLKEGKAIAQRERKPVGTDERSIELENKLKGLREERDLIIKERQQPAPEPGDYFQEISKKVEATEKRIKVLQAKVDAEDLSVEKGKEAPSHPLLDEARAKAKALNDQLAKMRSDAEKPAKEAEKAQNSLDDAQAKVVSLEAKLESGDLSKNPVRRKAVSDELQALRDQVKGLNKGLAKARSDAEKPAREIKAAERELQAAKDRVAAVEKRLSTGDLETKKPEPKPVPPELQAERDKLKELNKQLSEARETRDSNTPQSPDQYQKELASRLKRIQDRTKELERKRREKDFSKVEKHSPATSPELEKAQIQLGKTRQDFENDVFKHQQSLRTGSQKFWDGVVRAKRAFLLSSGTVFLKLGAAVQSRALSTTLEEMINHGIRGVVPKEVSEAAKLEGRGDASGYVKSYVKALGKWISDAKSIIKTGKTDIDFQHGKYRGERDEGWDSFLGKLHYVIKAPAKRAAFEHAAEKLTQSAIRDGLDPLDDTTKAQIMAGAYKAGERAIFMQDNFLVNGFRAMVASAENFGDKHNSGAAKGFSRAMRVLFPIVKVPTNMVGEALQYAGGVPVGLVRLAKVWRAGLDSIKPEEADLIMRELKKGSLGTALMGLGFLASGAVGGFYQEHEKRKLGEPGPGGVKFGGVDIPSWLMHSPAFMALQMGATLRRVAESKAKDGGKVGYPWGAAAALYGAISETPFINEMTRLGNLNSQQGREQFVGDTVKAQVEPQLLQQIAAATDNGPPRKPENITENLKMGIPGLRQEVGVKATDALPPSEHGKPLPPTIEQYSLSGAPMPAAPSKSELLKKNPSLTNDQWQRYAEERGKYVKSMLLSDIPLIRHSPETEQHAAIAAISHQASERAKRKLNLK